MRFMIMVKSTADSEAGVMPSTETIAAMSRFNEELINAGVMLAGEGLHPSSKGAKVKYQGGRFTVTDGPFAETKELIAGFWIIDVKDKEEALAWVRKIPFEEGEEIEVRKVFETADFAGIASEEDMRKEQEWRAAANQKPITPS